MVQQVAVTGSYLRLLFVLRKKKKKKSSSSGIMVWSFLYHPNPSFGGDEGSPSEATVKFPRRGGSSNRVSWDNCMTEWARKI